MGAQIDTEMTILNSLDVSLAHELVVELGERLGRLSGIDGNVGLAVSLACKVIENPDVSLNWLRPGKRGLTLDGIRAPLLSEMPDFAPRQGSRRSAHRKCV